MTDTLFTLVVENVTRDQAKRMVESEFCACMWANGMTFPTDIVKATITTAQQPAQPAIPEGYAKAIEFGEYLAKGAEDFLDALNALHDAKEAGDDLQEIQLEEVVSDHWRGLKSNIYEFRKRAQQAIPARGDSADIPCGGDSQESRDSNKIYCAPVHLLGPVGEVQVRFVSRQHMKDKPTEANPSPIRVVLLGDLQRVSPQATGGFAQPPQDQDGREG
jgi:hypothetical protein